MAETVDISDREMRLRNRNIKRNINKKRKLTEEELEQESQDRLFVEALDAHYRQTLEEVEKEKAERLQKYMEEPWPPAWKPIKESIQYKCGLISTFVDDPWGILNMDESDFKSDPRFTKWANDDDCLKKLKAFIKLVRYSRGYDVDYVPPRPLYSPFRPMDVDKVTKNREYYKEFIYPLLKCVVGRINARAKDFGKEFKAPYKVKKIVQALSYLKYLITFSGKLISHGRVVRVTVMDVQAMVHSEGGGDYECVEWRFKREDLIRKGCPPRSTSHSNTAVVAAPAADLELPKKNTKSEAKTKTETSSAVEKKGDAKAPSSLALKTIIIEHCRWPSSNEMRADRVKEALEGSVPGVRVVINPEGPRWRCFEIREEGGEVFVSLLNMSRPFWPLRALDMEKLIADIMEKIR